MTDDGYTHDPDRFDEDGPRSEYEEARAREDREFDWRGWVLVGVIVVSFLVIPAIILMLPYTAGPGLAVFGLTWRDTFLTLPLIPALVLGVAAVWATARA